MLRKLVAAEGLAGLDDQRADGSGPVSYAAAMEAFCVALRQPPEG